ncbi:MULTISPECIES: TRAP transporter substrate-binding protein DctP [unclassified Oceanobacter]|uniref:TRAP transporter substrate-binding protein n=1 Tax=unclassified Oceanobacter TaxID=2620260 RepID=UPI0026E2167D|nr:MULTISPECIES: TRAP transporter substrate-binding protein DctP [unclassified Oceanobacter]MDO6681926.1 TRAP transporter substrate-binding protein DctP [Oceanobacter sp. 5_MG-2023]MDP2505288.1 TRAP transporter substrate-binding protein DctP [Oceanobacter sp. 3_MG-2023]MDP2547962.1 TRAP transporter substrate-binding protein DctP [Oceanobacter sp. 4_MG-2023]
MKNKLIALGLMLLCLSPLSQAATLKIATLAPDGTNWMKQMRSAAADIKKATDGRVKIKYFPGGVQGSDKSVLRKMKIGQLQGGAVSAGALANIANEVQLYSLPFTFQNPAELSAVRPEFDHYIIDALEAKGYVVLGLTEGGFAYVMGNKPLKTTADFSGQKVWTPEGDLVTQTVFQKAGVEPISLPISDVYTSLQTGLIDTVGVNLTASIALQWHSKLSHATDLPLLSLLGMMVVDQKAFNKLSAEDQTTVRSIMKSTYAQMDKQNLVDEAGARQALENSGMTFVQLTDAEKATWQQLANDSLTELASQGVYPVELYRQLQAHIAGIRAGQ